MIQNFAQVLKVAEKGKPATIAVAAADDKEVLTAIQMAVRSGFARAILMGDLQNIKSKLGGSLPDGIEIQDVASDLEAAEVAAELIRDKKAQIIMKGMLNTSDFLRPVLKHLRTGRKLSHLAAFEIPGEDKLVFHTDGGMNISPSCEEKQDILRNAVEALACLGYSTIHVACLAANEKVDEKMPATVDARALQEVSDQFPGCIIEGPVALDVAVSPEAAKHKGIESRVSGKTDLFLVPGIESGNILGKALIYYAGAQMAGVVLGAACPIVLTSRAETVQGKFYSIALACLMRGNLQAPQ